MLKQWLALLMFAMVALSGCSDESPDEIVDEPTQEAETTDDVVDEDTDEVDESDDDPAAEAPESTENETVEVPNTPPMANLTADLVSITEGDAVTFTITAVDGEGDASWSLDADGDGAEDASGSNNDTASFTYSAPGAFVATLTVTDGEFTANATVAIDVAEAALEPLLITKHMLWGCWLCIDGANPATGVPGAEGCIGWVTGENEFDCGWTEVPAEYIGTPWSALSVTDGLLSPALGTDGDVDIEFYDECAFGATLIEHVADNSFAQPESGIIPEGAGCIVGFEFSWPNLGHTIEFSLGAVVHA